MRGTYCRKNRRQGRWSFPFRRSRSDSPPPRPRPGEAREESSPPLVLSQLWKDRPDPQAEGSCKGSGPPFPAGGKTFPKAGKPLFMEDPGIGQMAFKGLKTVCLWAIRSPGGRRTRGVNDAVVFFCPGGKETALALEIADVGRKQVPVLPQIDVPENIVVALQKLPACHGGGRFPVHFLPVFGGERTTSPFLQRASRMESRGRIP